MIVILILYIDMEKVLISACLLNMPCRYDGKGVYSEEVFKLFKEYTFVPLCAEVLGGLDTPREPSEIEPGRTAGDVLDGRAKIYSKSGRDVTDFFIDGANIVLDICLREGIRKAFLKEKSPSCGVSIVYNGLFDGTKKDGRGILAELLIRNGIEVVGIH